MVPSAPRAGAPSASKRSDAVLEVWVRFEPVRSALPPSNSGSAFVNASSASWLAFRLATVSDFVCAATAASSAVCAQSAGRSPRIRRM